MSFIVYVHLQWAKQLLQQGNTVVATARDPSSCAGLSQLAQQHGYKLVLTALDTSNEQSIADWAAQLKGKVAHIDVSKGQAVQYAHNSCGMKCIGRLAG
jgi:NADP-dependent 3-hydroxy acid dehydrogenase YdfG